MKLYKLNIGSRFECNGRRGTLLSVFDSFRKTPFSEISDTMENDSWADVQFDGETKSFIRAGIDVKPLDDVSKPKFVYNDGGRKEAGRKGDTGDCVTRAICIATGLPYMEVYNRLAEGNATQRKSKRERYSKSRNGVKTASHGIFTKRKWFKDYMIELGFEWTPTMTIGTGCQVHLKADELPKGKLVCNVSRHLVAVIDGVINDTYDCSRNGTRCVYGYWKLKD